MSFNPADYANENCSIEQVLEIKKSFDYFDIDKNGALNPKEFKAAINSLGLEVKAQAVYQMITKADQNGNGEIEFDEFFKMITTKL